MRWPQRTTEQRFWEKVDSRSPEGCWNWTAYRNRKGYGSFAVEAGLRIQAHRFAFALTTPIPDGMSVLHHCDNPSCVNPSHLFLGTNSDNVADKISKGRQASLSGELNPRAKLTQADVVRVREMRASGSTYSEIGKRFGVTRATAFDVCQRSWKHFSPPAGAKAGLYSGATGESRPIEQLSPR